MLASSTGHRGESTQMISRRGFLNLAPVVFSANALPWGESMQSGGGKQQTATIAPLAERYPAYAPELIEKVVTVSHFSLDKVKEIVEPHPQLVKASWDWGFGDWESPLGAACHMGRTDIAEYLLSKGATPSLFSAVFFGDLAVVKEMVERQPGIERVAGPHSISLLAHARMGGKKAEEVFAYLHALADADMPVPVPLAESETKAVVGSYQVGDDPSHLIVVSGDMHAYANTPMYTHPPQLGWKHNRTMERPLFHRGGMKFYPAGAPSIEIQFEEKGQKAVMTVTDGGEVLTASRSLTV